MNNVNRQNPYIKVNIPEIVPNNTIYKTEEELVKEVTITIACKSESHASFTGAHIPAKVRLVSEDIQVYNEETDKEENAEQLTFLELYGPFENQNLKTIYVEDEWHTANLRNIIQ